MIQQERNVRQTRKIDLEFIYSIIFIILLLLNLNYKVNDARVRFEEAIKTIR